MKTNSKETKRIQRIQKNRKPPSPPVEAIKREKFAKFDIPFFTIIILLCALGLTMLYSASFNFASREHNDSSFFFVNQARFMVGGLAAMISISCLDYRHLARKPIVFTLAALTLILMVAVVVKGTAQGGAERWLKIGPLPTFQPSEIMKFALIVTLAYIVHKHSEFLENCGTGFLKGIRRQSLFISIIIAVIGFSIAKPLFTGVFVILGIGLMLMLHQCNKGKMAGFPGFVLFIFIIGVACGLTIVQPHLSGTVIMFGIGLSMLVVSPVRFKYIGMALLILAIGVGVVLILIKTGSFPYASARLLGWENPEADIGDKTFQIYQSLVTIGSGGAFGLGLGHSRQKFAYMPASHNDFIFSVICEELGFVGGILILLLFAVFILRGYYIAIHARDRFGMMLATGITTQIGIQAFLNIAVATNTVPNTGIGLPFFSYGGTAILVLMAQLGVLLNISRRASIR